MKTAILILSILFSFYSIDLFSQKRNTKPISNSLFENISLRNIGPAKVSGRITKVVNDYTDKNTWYVTTASGIYGKLKIMELRCCQSLNIMDLTQ